MHGEGSSSFTVKAAMAERKKALAYMKLEDRLPFPQKDFEELYQLLIL